jgi:hypothetical protein
LFDPTGPLIAVNLFNKKGTLTDREIKSLVKEWHANRPEEELDALMVAMEMKAMEKKLKKI